MNANQALTVIIEHVAASDKAVSLGLDDVQQWNNGVLASFVAAGLLAEDVKARSLECTGCEHRCFMDVHMLEGDSLRAFIVCGEPDMQSQMGRINVPLERLRQWQSSTRQLAKVVADLLELESKPAYQKDSANYKLGMLKGNRGRCWVLLNVQPLSLEINRHTTPLSDLLCFSGDELVIDELRINALLDLAPVDTAKVYVSDVSKREAQTAATQLMYQNWQDAYEELKIKHPQQNKSWICRKIASMPVGQNKDSDYIRRKIKT